MLTSTQPETGQLMGSLPYVKVGDGPKTLLVIPGLGDTMFDGSYGRVGAWLARRTWRRYGETYTVYVVSRPRGLADGRTIRGMAADYARVLENRLESASVLGISMGGLIAQELAFGRPDLVDRLVVAVSGCRLSEEGARIVKRLQWYALERDWTEIRATLFEEMYTGRKQRVFPTLARSAGRVRPPNPADPEDVLVSIDAVLEYDGTDHLGEIEPRTLVIGGTDDPFFPEEILRETHERLPDAQLAMFRDARHGAFLERKEGFDNWVLQFLEGEEVRISQR
ncbi:alpha/beta hydrolase [Halobacteria archaeon AArc-m2/3/4]|uniref:Alpha/beta hydrolase n=1 Tax=Natronoglomus mannanivorans TaxID=2979990 RepID=A0ABT2Q977_9EURY|nr:alpha/beta hydrolase [Halobacteria archaeon AArc-m2/3/4]